MTATEVMEMTTFRRTKKGVRLVDDRGDLVVEWPDGCPNQPKDHADAAAQALAIVRGGRS